MIPLVNYSNYSMLKGAANLDSLIAAAKGYGLKSLALSDENGMYGLISFMKKCYEAGIKPLPGAHIDDPENSKKYAVLLPKNVSAYSELCRIITSRKLNEDFSIEGVLSNLSSDFVIITSSFELLKIL
jgi:DNA polymerase III alpha subunit